MNDSSFSETRYILRKIQRKKRLLADDALQLFNSHRLHQIAKVAYDIRMKLHPEKYVTYVIDRNINYTNVCISKCEFCAFSRDMNDEEAYVITDEELFGKIEETIEAGGNQILLQGGMHPELKLEWYKRLIQKIKDKYSDLHIHGFSPPEIVHISRVSDVDVKRVIEELKDVGLGSIPGGGAEILVPQIRKSISPNKCSDEEWLMVMKTAHRVGLKTTATMMMGHVESYKDRVEHLLKIRNLQDETGGFTAFIPWTFQPSNTRLYFISPRGAFDYLKTLAVARIFLDNIPNIQASWITQGPRIAQLALYYGANDMGGTMLEENVVKAAGTIYSLSISEIEDIITEAGFIPRQRDCFYNLIK